MALREDEKEIIELVRSDASIFPYMIATLAILCSPFARELEEEIFREGFPNDREEAVALINKYLEKMGIAKLNTKGGI